MEQVEELYNKYFHDVFLYVKSLSNNDSISEEITQETFFKAIKSVNSFKGNCDIRVWLCQIAKNTYYMFCKNKNRFIDEEIPEAIASSGVSLEEKITDSEQSIRIHQVLHNMEDPYKEVFTLGIFGELSFKQIGQIFGKTESWARVTFHRAKLKIVNEMEDNYE